MDQALLYFVDLRVRVRHVPQAPAIVDRCVLAEARSADASAAARLQEEVDELRADLMRRLGPPKRLRVC